MATLNANTYPTNTGALYAGLGDDGLKVRYLKARVRNTTGAALTTADTVNLGILKTGITFLPSLSFQTIASGATGLGVGGFTASWVNIDKSAGTAILLTQSAAAASNTLFGGTTVTNPTAGADVPVGSALTITWSGAAATTCDTEVFLAYIEHADQ